MGGGGGDEDNGWRWLGLGVGDGEGRPYHSPKQGKTIMRPIYFLSKLVNKYTMIDRSKEVTTRLIWLLMLQLYLERGLQIKMRLLLK